MSVYERQSYAPKSTVGQTVSTTSTISTKKRRLIFATEWYWYPKGVKAVADRFNTVLAQRELIAEHSWDEENVAFHLRCRAQDARVIAEEFLKVLKTIIKDELRQGFKDPWADQEEEPADEDDGAHYDKLLKDLGTEDEEEIMDSELEALELDMEESLESELIRRLKLREDEVRVGAQLNTAVESDFHRARSPAGDDAYPSPIRSLQFKDKWLEYYKTPLELEKTFPDEMLAELKRLTGCEFSKCIRTGTLYIGCDAEQGLQLAKIKLGNLKLISEMQGPYHSNILYHENLDVVRFVLQFMANIRKDYFATTLLDNLHLAINCDDREDGKLLPVWKKVSDAATVRSTQQDASTGIYEAAKKVELLPIPASKDAQFKDWDGFKYASRNETSYLRQYIDPKTGGLLLRPPKVPAAEPVMPPMPAGIPRSASLNTVGIQTTAMPRFPFLNTIELSQNTIPRPTSKASELPPMNVAAQKIMSIQNWLQEGVGRSTVPEFLQSKIQVEPAGTPSWDTYKEIDIETIRCKKLKSTVPVISKGFERGAAALKHSVTGKSISGDSRGQPTRQAPANKVSGSVSRLSMEQPVDTSSGMQKIAPQHKDTPEQPAPSIPLLLAGVTNSKTINHAKGTEALIDFDVDVDVENVLSTFESRTLLDDDISMVAGSVLQPARDPEYTFTRTLPLLHHLQAAQAENLKSIEDDLIFLTPSEGSQELVDMSTTAVSEPTEKLQTENEVDTRVFHATMNQKSGKGGKKGGKSFTSSKASLPLPSPPRPKQSLAKEPVEDPSAHIINDSMQNFTELLESVRFFRGPLQVQLEFGRIILTDVPIRLIWQKSGDKVFDHNALRSKLNSTPAHKMFTSVLSSIPQEMEYLVALKNSEGQPVWQPSSVSPPKWEVTYEFHYRDLKALDSPYLAVKVDGKTFKTQVFTRKELGEIDVHDIVRHWDYRIAVTGQENIKPADHKAYSVHDSLEKSLCIPFQTETPRLLWEMENSLTERFQLIELMVKRVKKYAGYTAFVNGGSELNITECQSLEVETLEVPERSSCIFMAAPCAYDRHPTEKLTNWWEASIHSVQLDKMLQENEKLSLGEEPSWATTPLDPSIAPALFLPGCAMLKQMDSVGQQNRNGVIRREVPQPPKVTKKPQIADDDGFW